jgi:hypothetical protein
VRRLALAQPLAERRTHSIEEYEAIRADDNVVDQAPVHTLSGHSQAGMIAFVGVDNQRRVYE